MAMGFERALRALKEGRRVRRTGWNGKGMWLQVADGVRNRLLGPVDMVSPGMPMPEPLIFEYPPHIVMKTATNELVPWLASVTDLMAEDWELVEFWEK